MPVPPDPHAALRDALGGAEPPPAVLALDDAVVADLAAAVADARRAEAEALAASGERSLKLLPLPLRIGVRKVLGL
jgi:hypothetical protein